MFPVDLYEANAAFSDRSDPPSPTGSEVKPEPEVAGVQIDSRALDALIDALMAKAGSQARAAVVCAVVAELCASVAWLQQPGLETEETVSLRHVLDAADDHRDRMSRLTSTESGEADQ